MDPQVLNYALTSTWKPWFTKNPSKSSSTATSSTQHILNGRTPGSSRFAIVIVLEEVGTTGSVLLLSMGYINLSSIAYTGGTQSVHNKDYLTAATSILAVEARHEAWINSIVMGSSAWDTVFQTSLLPNPVYSLASAFIKSYPASNADSLPALTAYPALAFSDAHAHPGHTASLQFTPLQGSSPRFVTFVSGPGAPVFVPLQANNQVAIPNDLRGFVFCFVTSDGRKLDDSTTVAGPVISNVAYNAERQIV
ncbi:hypothetical protein B0H13DRAFT_2663751 [Mycena leptocephala]|nr:hypothetical protein B0H13DRAFT_2663751 [Mycena leptocephala]